MTDKGEEVLEFTKKGTVKSARDRLIIDKAMVSALVEDQLSYIFNYKGIPEQDYLADLDKKTPLDMFYIGSDLIEKCKEQVDEEIVSGWEYFDKLPRTVEYIPRIEGGNKYNPYQRYKNVKSVVSRQISKVLDLPLDYPVWKLTLTYPNEISDLNITLGMEKTDKLMTKCYKRFFVDLHTLKVNGKTIVQKDHKMACLVNNHPWSSRNPITPHAHHHATIPGVSVYWGTNGFNGKFNKMIARRRRDVDNRIKGKFKEADRSDPDVIKQINKTICEGMGIVSLEWIYDKENKKNVPIPLKEIKQLWKETVFSVFKDLADLSRYNDPDFTFDVHGEYEYSRFNDEGIRAQIGHWMKYSKRPASLDLNTFFHYNPGVVSQSILDCGITIDPSYIVNASTRERVFNYDKDDLLEYLADLSTRKTTTKIYGFWRLITSFQSHQNDDLDHNNSISPVTGQYRIGVGSINRIPYETDVFFTYKSRIAMLPYILKPPGGS